MLSPSQSVDSVNSIQSMPNLRGGPGNIGRTSNTDSLPSLTGPLCNGDSHSIRSADLAPSMCSTDTTPKPMDTSDVTNVSDSPAGFLSDNSPNISARPNGVRASPSRAKPAQTNSDEPSSPSTESNQTETKLIDLSPNQKETKLIDLSSDGPKETTSHPLVADAEVTTEVEEEEKGSSNAGADTADAMPVIAPVVDADTASQHSSSKGDKDGTSLGSSVGDVTDGRKAESR